MTRGALAMLFVFAAVAGTWAGRKPPQHSPSDLQWIWFDEGDPAAEAPAETRYFRRVFSVLRPSEEASLEITADNRFTVWLNGAEVGRGDDWHRVARFDVKKHLSVGTNVLAVEAHNTDGPAGLLARLSFIPGGQTRVTLVSDGAWKASRAAAEGWRKADFAENGWTPVQVIGPYGSAGPWRDLVWGEGRGERFTVPPGFRVEMAVQNPDPKDPFSLINLTFDARGRLLISQENGPVLLCTRPDKDGVFQTVKPYCKQVRNCQGMCWVRDALLLVGDGPQGAGLYRVRDTRGVDETDKVELLHKFVGGMGEHGPHAILHGPDDCLYLVTGNHAWAKPSKLAANSPLTRWPNGQMGPDQGKAGTTEDVLLPRLNDARGHAADILAPGGTIWRTDHDGKNMSLVAAGFRNAYDAAFSPAGELFTFDSDMEWDIGLPWYRAVRICHVPPGADFVWRTGSANTPDFYIDSLPPMHETGRGSPVGMEFYDHHAFPAKYRGALFLGDWSLGIIHAVHLERSGASYNGTVERFCVGSPMNVTDLAVGPDGAVYFTMGGRGTQGGVYRIVYGGSDAPRPVDELNVPGLVGVLAQPQPLSAWGRAADIRCWNSHSNGEAMRQKAAAAVTVQSEGLMPAAQRMKLLTASQNLHSAPSSDVLITLTKDKCAEIRAHAVWLLGVNGYAEGRYVLLDALKDADALVRRRACEALLRAGFEPGIEDVWPLLADPDRFVRTAARLVLQRIDAAKWASRLCNETDDRLFREGVIALCKTGRVAPHAGLILERLRATEPGEDVRVVLDHLRTLQMVLIHAGSPRDEVVSAIAARCARMFPHDDWRVNRELAILLGHFGRHGDFRESVPAKLLDALQSEKDRAQQIHYFYCLRFSHQGWTSAQKAALLAWYDGTRDWKGGESFAGFLHNILRDAFPIFTAADRREILARADQRPYSAAAVLRLTPVAELPRPAELAELYKRFADARRAEAGWEIKEAVMEALGRTMNPETPAALRRIAERDPSARDAVAWSLARFPAAENWPCLLRGLETTNRLWLADIVAALRKVNSRPKLEEPYPYRALIAASGRLEAKDRWKAVELLRHWTDGKQFGAETGDWKAELAAWSRWFAQTFPQEPPLPDASALLSAESKYRYDELLAFLERDPAGRAGEPSRGRLVFEKAQCAKCHKFGSLGEGVGPDLTTLSSRFKRADTLESIYYPSKVISDQYRSTTIITTKGQQITGLAAPQGDTVTVLQSDGSKIALKKDEIEQQFASLVSVMPEKLLDALTKAEIADLFAFLESDPPKAQTP
jgi:putative heme-binding domain-containing protein